MSDSPPFDVQNIPLDDPAVWKMLGKGYTKGVFQLESPLGKHWCKRLRPQNIEHLAALGALLRPGCLEAKDAKGINMTERYCRRKNGEEPIEIKYECLRDILEPTYGVLSFQEQSIFISQKVAGFSLEEADILRKACGKKLPKLMTEVKIRFLEGCKKVGLLNEEEAQEVFGWIEKSQRYSFNKCISQHTLIRRIDDHVLTVEEMYKIRNDINYAKSTKHLSLHNKWKSQGHYGKGLSLCKDGKIRPNLIKDIQYAGLKTLYRIKLDNDAYMDGTDNHKFPTPNGILATYKLNVNDKLFICDKQGRLSHLVKIASIRYLGLELFKTYDVTMEAPNHNFVTGTNIVTCNSHAVSYAINGYRSAYCKTHYPLEFFTSYCYHAKEKQDPKREIRELIQEMKLFNIPVKGPDFCDPQAHFHTNGQSVLFGLADVRGIGEAQVKKIRTTINQIGKEPKDWTWYEFLTCFSDKISITCIKALVSVGSLDYMNIPRQCMLAELNVWYRLTDKEKQWIINKAELTTLILALRAVAAEGGGCANYKRRNAINSEVKLLQNPPSPLIDTPEWIAWNEEYLLGVSLSCSKIESCDTNLVNCTCRNFLAGQAGWLILGVEIVSVRVVRIKNGQNRGRQMAFLTISDDTCALENVVCFPDVWDINSKLFYEGNTVIMQGKRDKKRNSFVVQKVAQI